MVAHAYSAVAAEAEQVLERLAAIGWPAEEGASPAEHRPFVQLYHCTTRRWLADLRPRSDGYLGHLMVRNFHRRYEACVGRVVAGQSDEIAPQWRRYFAVARAAERRLSARRRALLVFHGLLAHTGPDLADAICLTDAEVRAATGAPPDRAVLHDVLLSKRTDAIFLAAAEDYLVREGPTLSVSAARRLRTVWLPAFQSLRRAGWADALRRIEAARGQPVALFPD